MPKIIKQRFHERSALASSNGTFAGELHLPPVYIISLVPATSSIPGTLHTTSTPITSRFANIPIFSSYPYSTLSSAFVLGGHHSSLTAEPIRATPSSFVLSHLSSVSFPMGQPQSLIPSSFRPSRPSSSPRRPTFSSHVRPTPAPNVKPVPSDNIFVPIQPDDIPGSIPIHLKHPLPRTGIEDSDNPIQTNRFYANAFLGKQDQPIWTQPYFIWWGKGSSDPNQFQTWGMNVGHAESEDLEFGPGDPPKVRGLWLFSFDATSTESSEFILTIYSIIMRLETNWLYLARQNFLMEHL